jgi:putative IMPACT (imprinted ancient) family translation regulator
VRAYQKSVQEGLNNSQIIEKRNGLLLYIKTDYNGLGKLQYLFAQKEIAIQNSEYGADVVLTVLVPVERKEEIGTAITEATNATAKLTWADEVIYALVDKQVQLFS